MTVDQLISLLEEMKENNRGAGYWRVTNHAYFDITDAFLDVDENGDTVAVID